MKRQNGITLIALVITIIVLLILAGVSIASISGENGIVTKAKEAAQKTEEGEKKEQEDLEKIEDWIDEASGDGFPFGTLYTMAQESTVMGMVIYQDCSYEGYYVVGDDLVLGYEAPAGTLVFEGNKINMVDAEDSEAITISDDYSTLSGNGYSYRKTSKTITQCAHTWEETDNEEFSDCQECSKCGVYKANS